MKIVMVLTSHNQLGNTGRKTGFWLEEFAAPYFVFRDAGVQLTLASPKGGQPPIDPKSDLPESQTDAMARFKRDAGAQQVLSQTVKLADVKADRDHWRSQLVDVKEYRDHWRQQAERLALPAPASPSRRWWRRLTG